MIPIRLLLLALAIALAPGLFSPTVARADTTHPEPTPTATAGPSSAGSSPINLIFQWDFSVIGTAVQRSLQAVFGGIATGLQEHVFAPIAQSSLNIFTQTPPSGTYANA